jgi:hypothetical protein
MKPLYQFALGFGIGSVLAAPAHGDGFAATGGMAYPRYNHTATRLLDGRVLVVAGRGEDGVTASAELCNPATGAWTTTSSLNNVESREFHTATLLPNGKVLVAGGTTAELYDPATGTWSPAGNPGTSGTATLLLNGKVLVAGAGAALYESSLNPITIPVRLGDGSFQFAFNNPSGPSYHILASPNLAAPLNTWSNLGSPTETPPGSGQFQYTDHQATNYSQRFYRVSLP